MCPQAAQNFSLLCEGTTIPDYGDKIFRYINCPVHRIVKNGWIQAGDIVDGTGKHSIAASGIDSAVPDECFSVDFGFPQGGIIGYANEGSHTNRSQFFITTGPCAWMNQKFVGFGRVIQGFDTLEKLNSLQTSNQAPINRVFISNCGEAPEFQIDTYKTKE